ncbi:hypothetical protein [Bacillus atrophaeus]|nr:hypothetical protein [Bacillus atrophaeus]MCY8840334.1 hypothetical protein [Bacillus atrophaeus]MEC0803483.1 hypothetical protein [Bacillus atrophaeus]MEC0854322.1 hypothetical protein [Bacillus atrophaeus]MEC0857524.1 hypothetical protein [Bacillus atrophaeus]MEC0860789.1 hypothetical protein [Bacillus atrophaeus]
MTTSFESFINLLTNVCLMPWWAKFNVLAAILGLYSVRLIATSIQSIKKGETELTFSFSIKNDKFSRARAEGALHLWLPKDVCN